MRKMIVLKWKLKFVEILPRSAYKFNLKKLDTKLDTIIWLLKIIYYRGGRHKEADKFLAH